MTMYGTATLERSPARVVAGPAPLGTPTGSRRTHALRWAIAWTVTFGSAFVWRASTVVAGQRTFTLFDDALVSARYAHQLAGGHGLVWNAGQPGVEGYTNLLWTLWMAALFVVGVPVRLLGVFVSATGLALLVANLVVIAALCRRLAPNRPVVERTALLLTATCFPLLFWTLRGMEVGLVAVVLSSAVLLAYRVADGDERALALSALLVAAGVLTRTDVAVPLTVVISFAVARSDTARRARVARVLGGTLVAVVAGHMVLSLRWYGHALPNTYALKLQGIPLADRLERGVLVTLLLALMELAAPLALALVALRTTRGRARAELSLLSTVFASCVLYAVYVGGDAWEWMRMADRYVAPALPLLFVLAGVGLDRLAHGDARARSRHLLIASCALAVGVLVAIADPFPHGLLQLDTNGTRVFVPPLMVAMTITLSAALWLWARPTAFDPTAVARITAWAVAAALVLATSGAAFATWTATGGPHVDDDATMAAIAAAVTASTSPQTTVAVTWGGSVPYFSDRPAIDLLGKSDPAIATSPLHDVPLQPGHMRWDYAYSIGVLRPDLVVGLWLPTADDEAALQSWGYERVTGEVWIRFDAPGIDVETLRARLAGLCAPTVC